MLHIAVFLASHHLARGRRQQGPALRALLFDQLRWPLIGTVPSGMTAILPGKNRTCRGGTDSRRLMRECEHRLNLCLPKGEPVKE
jgi:hypothetical protein